MQKLEKAGEPTMEEILASIRQIISEEPAGARPLPTPIAPPSRPPAPPAFSPPPQATRPVLPATPVPPAFVEPAKPALPAPQAQAPLSAPAILEARPAPQLPPPAPPLAQPPTDRGQMSEAISESLAGPPKRPAASLTSPSLELPQSMAQYGRSMWRFGKRPDNAQAPQQQATADTADLSLAIELPGGAPEFTPQGEMPQPLMPAAEQLPPPPAPGSAALPAAPIAIPVPTPAVQTPAAGGVPAIVAALKAAVAPPPPVIVATEPPAPAIPPPSSVPVAAAAAPVAPPADRPAPTPQPLDTKAAMTALAANLASGFQGRPQLAETDRGPGEPAAASPPTPAAPVPLPAAPIQKVSAPVAASAAPLAVTLPIAAIVATPASPPAATPVPVASMAPMMAAAGVLPPVKSLEDVVVELLRPMLRQWLDENMPRIVEKSLRIELAEQFKKPGTPKV